MEYFAGEPTSEVPGDKLSFQDTSIAPDNQISRDSAVMFAIAGVCEEGVIVIFPRVQRTPSEDHFLTIPMLHIVISTPGLRGRNLAPDQDSLPADLSAEALRKRKCLRSARRKRSAGRLTSFGMTH